MPTNSAAFVDFLKARMEAGEFRAVIDRKYPLEPIADAYWYDRNKRFPPVSSRLGRIPSILAIAEGIK